MELSKSITILMCRIISNLELAMTWSVLYVSDQEGVSLIGEYQN